jgi:iron complex transport system substrate-binding protein
VIGRRAFLELALVFTPLAAACRKSTPIAKDEKATRIVSISPSTTEAVDAIGARSLLVGRSRYCDYPPEIQSLPEIGGYIDPNIEAILALRPDLVVGARGPSGSTITETLAAHGIATYFPKTESFAEIDAMIAGIGERCGRAKEAADVVATMHADEEKLAASLEGKPKPRVLFVFGVTPIVVAGPGSFADEMVSRAHATNAVTEGSGYPTLGIERVLAIDPDVIVEAAWGESGSQAIAKDAAGWGRLRAVREGRVDHIADESILRPGPRVVRGVEKLARAIHP